MNWADINNCKCCHSEGTENVDCTVIEWKEEKNKPPDIARSCENKAQVVKIRLEMAEEAGVVLQILEIWDK